MSVLEDDDSQTEQGLRLLRAFWRIEDPEIRLAILMDMETRGEREQPGLPSRDALKIVKI